MPVLRNGRRVLIVALVGVLLIAGVGVVTVRGHFAAHTPAAITVADAFAVPQNDPQQIEDPSSQTSAASDEANVDCGPASPDATPQAAHLIARLGCAP